MPTAYLTDSPTSDQRDLGRAHIDAMRAWLADCYWPDMTPEQILDPIEVSDDEILLAVHRVYEGGIDEFVSIELTSDPSKADPADCVDGIYHRGLAAANRARRHQGL